ncbi:MAG TPA: DNA polymerase Y family protein [Spirochaetia bacterium]|nr:DNA polymerase Y family protein [Spirochaetia bacterium]
MAHRGCISVDHLPLQILLRENPGWKDAPVAVTREERPQSPILALNRPARDKGLSVGMKYASALSLVPSLRARVVPTERVAESRQRIARVLSTFTPDIELCPFDDDAVWVSVGGLGYLYDSDTRWLTAVRQALASEGFRANVILGFTRFGTYAIARSSARSLVFTSRGEEQALVSRSSIDILPLSPKTKNTLRKLEIRTVQQFVSLPSGETARRFGQDAGLLRDAILADDPLPIQPLAIMESAPCGRRLDSPLTDLDLLMPHIHELLEAEGRRAESAKSVISGLTLTLRTESGEVTRDVIRPAAPTLKMPLLGRLIQLRLSSRRFSSGVEAIEILSARTSPSGRQDELFSVKGRDLAAGARAIASLRARFGDDSVSRAVIVHAYLPEKSFRWEQVRKPALPARQQEAKAPGSTAAVRRIFFAPRQVPSGSRELPFIAGPFITSGSWWGSAGKEPPYLRHYGFRDSGAGISWVFQDRLTGESWIQGMID